jgi:SAM-dependent methyltransferase
MKSKNEKYDFEIGEEGMDYDTLDTFFNPTTQALIKNYIKPGMKVLDVGCGTGVMTAWLAKQVGEDGTVTAIDNSEPQLNMTTRRITKENLKNVQTKVLSAYDIGDIGQKFDLIYCRFLLHHLHSPIKTIKLFYENLNSNGIYIGEEGIVSAAFAYPTSFAWQGYMPTLKNPAEIKDDEGRDGDFGMKLFYFAKQAGFAVDNCNIMQPMLWKKEHKAGLLKGLIAFKQTELEQGTTEEAWQKKYDETVRLINDDNQVLGFYGSCQIAALKVTSKT